MCTQRKVIVIGGGIGGLALTQGLRRRGVDVALYERDRTRTDRLQGYRLHLDPTGDRALRECLTGYGFAAVRASRQATRQFTAGPAARVAFKAFLRVAAVLPPLRRKLFAGFGEG